MPAPKRDYYKEIDTALKSLENYSAYPTKDIYWVCDRIAWAWKWRKINESQKDELAERAIKYMEAERGC